MCVLHEAMGVWQPTSSKVLVAQGCGLPLLIKPLVDKCSDATDISPDCGAAAPSAMTTDTEPPTSAPATQWSDDGHDDAEAPTAHLLFCAAAHSSCEVLLAECSESS